MADCAAVHAAGTVDVAVLFSRGDIANAAAAWKVQTESRTGLGSQLQEEEEDSKMWRKKKNSSMEVCYAAVETTVSREIFSAKRLEKLH